MKNKGSGNVTGLKFENRIRTRSRTRSPTWRSLILDFPKSDAIPTPGIEPGPRRWERRILTTRPRGRSWYAMKMLGDMILMGCSNVTSVSMGCKIPSGDLNLSRDLQKFNFVPTFKKSCFNDSRYIMALPLCYPICELQYCSQTKWSVPLKIALMNWLFEPWTR